MSAGKFLDVIYNSDAGLAFSIRCQQETVTPWNPVGTGTPAAGAATAKVSGGRNKIGVNARLARFKWVGNIPPGYDPSGVITLPIFTQAAYQGFVKNISYPYLGGGLQYTGRTPEKIR